MKISPSIRKNANQMGTHHMLWRRKAWMHESPAHRHARNLSSYQFEVPRHVHDRIHVVFEPVQPPSIRTANSMAEIGESVQTYNDTNLRVNTMLDMMAGWVHHQPSPELADEMRETMAHISGQLAVYELFRGLHE